MWLCVGKCGWSTMQYYRSNLRKLKKIRNNKRLCLRFVSSDSCFVLNPPSLSFGLSLALSSSSVEMILHPNALNTYLTLEKIVLIRKDTLWPNPRCLGELWVLPINLQTDLFKNLFIMSGFQYLWKTWELDIKLIELKLVHKRPIYIIPFSRFFVSFNDCLFNQTSYDWTLPIGKTFYDLSFLRCPKNNLKQYKIN